MKRKRVFIVCVVVCIITSVNFCDKPKHEKIIQAGLTEELTKLQTFLEIPIYPNSELVNITTPLHDDKIPNEPMQAQVTLTIDEYENVPPFYEKQLGQRFIVDIDGDKKYYELQFEKGDWLYIIFVGHDTFENTPCFSIEKWKK